jgi:hypothetical protein
MLSHVGHCRTLVLASLVMASAVSATAAMAQNGVEARPVDVRVSHRPNVQDRSLSDAVRHVQRTTGGRILGAERVPFDGRDINRVKYMDDRGRVRYMDDPAPSRRQRVDRTAEATPRHPNP